MLLAPLSASADERILERATYPDMTTFSCRTNPIEIHPGQNLNDFNVTKACPNAEKVSGPGTAAIFGGGSNPKGYITRFKPSMLEIKPNGDLVTPRVWDLHLHHVVWLPKGRGATFASGEEKTMPMFPQGYGFKIGANDDWGINQMIHNLGARGGRQVYITWEIDWVPERPGGRSDIEPMNVRWMDVAGAPQIYPVFDAERAFDRDGDGDFTFPDDVPTQPGVPGYEERKKISRSQQWTIPSGGATLLFGAGHLHPGGKSVDLQVARDGPDPGRVDGDTPSEVRKLFRSKARNYDPAGSVSWDLAMKATRRNWRISLKEGDTVSISVTYDVSRASWYESMGIMPLAWSSSDDRKARDPYKQRNRVERLYKAGGVLTHGRLEENIDKQARKNRGLADPRKLKPAKPVPSSGVDIDSFNFLSGGFIDVSGFPKKQMRPPTIASGQTVTFTNLEAQAGQPQTEQVWHSITSCRAPCNKGSGIGYPLANGPIGFDSGQLGYGSGTSREVTTGSDTYTTPPLTARRGAGKAGSTYTYFCRIHPLTRGSVRVERNNR